MAPEPYLVGLALFDLVYLLAVLTLTDQFFPKSPEATESIFCLPPPVSIVVPVRDRDDGIYENFMSLCQQDYPMFQVIFAVEGIHDTAVPVIHRVIRDCPGRDISLVISDQKIGANEKVNNLENGYRQAKYDHLVFIDSDARVQPDYLKQVIVPLGEESVGLVTCMPVYQGSQNIPAALETVGINSNIFALFIPMFLMGGMKYASGATLAMRRQVLEAIGGFKAVANLVADDAEIGQLVFEKGYRIHLSHYVIHTVHQRDSWSGYFYHTLRWNRTIRAVTPLVYLSFAFFFGTFYTFLVWLMNPTSPWAFGFFLFFSFFRIVTSSYYNDHYIKDPGAQQYLWLIPIRDLLFPFEWLLGWAGRTIRWRGQCYRILKGARLEKVR